MASNRSTHQIIGPGTGRTRLTARQAEILQLVAQGLSGKQIARRLGISVRTVEYHFAAMRQLTGTHSLAELIAYQTAAGIAHPEPGPAPGGPGSREKTPPGNPSANGVPPDPLRDGIRDGRLANTPPANGNGARIGYARVSAPAEDHQAQLDALAAAHCREIIVETARIRDGRPQLRRALGMLRAGDTLVIFKPGCIARSMKELLVLLGDELHPRGISLHILTGSCAGLHRPDGATVASAMLFMVAAMAAEMERDLARERSGGGLAADRAQTSRGGRPAAVNADVLAIARACRERGESVTVIARHLGIGRSTLYRALELEHNGDQPSLPAHGADPASACMRLAHGAPAWVASRPRSTMIMG